MFKRFNIWYDKLREPKRFMFFLVATLAWNLPLVMAERNGNIVLQIMGGIGLVLMICIAISRI